MKSTRSEDDWAAIQAQQRLRYVCQTVFGALAVVLVGWLVIAKGAAPTQSDIDAEALRAPKVVQPFQPIGPADPSILASIDMARVHRQLLPAWIMSLQHSPHSIGHRDAEDAYRRLLDEAGKDPNLGLLLDRLHERLMDGTYDFHGETSALIKGWNDYLARGGVPFRLEHHIEKTVRGPELRLRSYRMVADVPVTLGNSVRHLLLLSRQDQTNLIEAFFGQTSADRGTALVVTDRIAEYAIERLWPLFQPHNDPSEPELMTKVRQEAHLGLDQSVVELLARAFSVRSELGAELSSLARRRGCGAGILIERVPWNGLSDRALAMVNRVAQKNELRHCPRVTQSDADRISAISQQLRGHAGVAQALGMLAGWLTKAVAVHESRHLADDRSDSEVGGARLCRGCPESFDATVRAEVSAYLASFETPGVGYVALLQACGVDANGRESHSAAIEFLLPKLLANGCAGPVPDDFYARAAAVRAELFGHREAIDLPASFPQTIPIPGG